MKSQIRSHRDARVPTALIVMALCGTCPVGAQAQTAPAATVPPAGTGAPVTEAPTGSDWHITSRSSTRVYMADINGIQTEDGVKRVVVARVATDKAPGDYSHATDVFEYRCAARESRTTVGVEYDNTGAEVDRYEDPTAWTPVNDNALDGFVFGVVCGDSRSASPTFPSIKAYVDAGRP